MTRIVFICSFILVVGWIGFGFGLIKEDNQIRDENWNGVPKDPIRSQNTDTTSLNSDEDVNSDILTTSDDFQQAGSINKPPTERGAINDLTLAPTSSHDALHDHNDIANHHINHINHINHNNNRNTNDNDILVNNNPIINNKSEEKQRISSEISRESSEIASEVVDNLARHMVGNNAGYEGGQQSRKGEEDASNVFNESFENNSLIIESNDSNGNINGIDRNSSIGDNASHKLREWLQSKLPAQTRQCEQYSKLALAYLSRGDMKLALKQVEMALKRDVEHTCLPGYFIQAQAQGVKYAQQNLPSSIAWCKVLKIALTRAKNNQSMIQEAVSGLTETTQKSGVSRDAVNRRQSRGTQSIESALNMTMTDILTTALVELAEELDMLSVSLAVDWRIDVPHVLSRLKLLVLSDAMVIGKDELRSIISQLTNLFVGEDNEIISDLLAFITSQDERAQVNAKDIVEVIDRLYMHWLGLAVHIGDVSTATLAVEKRCCQSESNLRLLTTLLELTNQSSRAIEILSNAYFEDGSFESALYLIARIHERSGEVSQALAAYSKLQISLDALVQSYQQGDHSMTDLDTEMEANRDSQHQILNLKELRMQIGHILERRAWIEFQVWQFSKASDTAPVSSILDHCQRALEMGIPMSKNIRKIYSSIGLVPSPPIDIANELLAANVLVDGHSNPELIDDTDKVKSKSLASPPKTARKQLARLKSSRWVVLQAI